MNLQKDLDRLQIKSEEFKIFCVKNTGDYYTCYHSEYISNYKAFVKVINLEITKRLDDNIKETTLSLLDNAIVHWSTNIHMKLTLLMRDMKEFLDSLGQELEVQHIPKSEQKYIQHLRVLAQCELNIEINQVHKAKISLGKPFFNVSV